MTDTPALTSSPSSSPAPVAAKVSYHLRLWVGMRRPQLAPAEFGKKLMEQFIPATAELMGPRGLLWYAPVILPFDKPWLLADEVALLVYRSEAIYKGNLKTSRTAQMYNAAHGDVFDTSVSFSRSSNDWAAPERGQGSSLNDAAGKKSVGATLGCGDWPQDVDFSQLNGEHLAMAAVQLDAACKFAGLQAQLPSILQQALERMQANTPFGPLRLWLVWRDHSGSSPGRMGSSLYLWCLCPAGHHWARDVLSVLLDEVFSLPRSAMDMPLWRWQSGDFEVVEPDKKDDMTDVLTYPNLLGSPWGRSWVLAPESASAVEETLAAP